MTSEEESPAGPVDRRGAVARLTEALAAAQAVARASQADLDEPPVASAGTTDADAPSAATTGSELGESAADPGAAEDESGLRDRIAALPSVDGAHDLDEATGRSDGEPDDEPHPAGTPVVDEPDGSVRTKRRGLGVLYVVMVLLIAAVPTLGYVGYRLAADSTAGEVLAGRNKPSAPGYTALVEPTPAALVIHVSDDRVPQGLTVLSLSGPDQRGGAILTAPVDVRLTKPRLGVESFAGIIDVNRTATAGKVIGSELGLGFTDVVEVTDSDLTTLIEPVAPLQIENPEPVTFDDGEVLDAGPVELTAARVPAYLAAVDDGDTISGRLDRAALVWDAWITAIAASGRATAVPGETDAGIGRYLTGLAAGKVATGTFPVSTAADVDGEPAVKIDHDPAMLLIANAVPFPVAAIPGQRATVALLNGTGPDAAPASVIQRLTFAGAQITTMGNASRFDHAETTLTYHDAPGKVFATVMADRLGVGRLVQSRSPDDGVDVVVVMGRDLLSDPPGPMTVQDLGERP